MKTNILILIFLTISLIGYSNNKSKDKKEGSKVEVKAESNPVLVLEIMGVWTVIQQGHGWKIIQCRGLTPKCCDIWLYADGTYQIEKSSTQETFCMDEKPDVKNIDEQTKEITFDYYNCDQ